MTPFGNELKMKMHFEWRREKSRLFLILSISVRYLYEGNDRILHKNSPKDLLILKECVILFLKC